MRRFLVITSLLAVGILLLPAIAQAGPCLPGEACTDSSSPICDLNPSLCDPRPIGVGGGTVSGYLVQPTNRTVGGPVGGQSATFCYPNTTVCYGVATGSGSAGATVADPDGIKYSVTLPFVGVIVNPGMVQVTVVPPGSPGASVTPGSPPGITPHPVAPRVCPVVGTSRAASPTGEG